MINDPTMNMIRVSNNSILTGSVANIIKSKFSEKEIRDFNQWLKLVENTTQHEVNRAKRKSFF